MYYGILSWHRKYTQEGFKYDFELGVTLSLPFVPNYVPQI